MRNINLKIDINKQSYIYEDCMQNDDIVLQITLLESGIPYNIGTNKVTLNWVKSDNTFVLIAGDTIKVTANIVSVTLPKDCTRAVGQAKFELVITDNASKQISTFPLSLEVIGSILQGQQVSNNLATIVEEINNANTTAINTKIALDESIRNGDTTKMRNDIDQNISQLADFMNFLNNGGSLFNTLNFAPLNDAVDTISTTKGVLGINAGTKGIVVDGTNNALRPSSTAMDTMTIGTATYGFKDVILSGNLSIKDTLNSKGTFASGVWTPVLYCSSGMSNTLNDMTTSSCHWIKIGSLVIAFFALEVKSWNTAWSSQTVLLTGLPYTRNLNKFATGVVTRFYGSTSNLQSDILAFNGHDTHGGAYWLQRSVNGLGTYGSVQLGWMNQIFGLAGYVMYSV